MGKYGDGVAIFGSGDVMEFGDQGRLANFTEMSDGGFGKSEPIMPVAEGVLYFFKFGDELHSFRGGSGQLGGVAGALAENAILVQDSLAEWSAGVLEAGEHGFCSRQRIAAGFGLEVSGCAFQALANVAESIIIGGFSKLLFLPAAQFDEAIDELSFAPGFVRDFQAAEGGELNVQVSKFAGAFADLGQQLKKFFLATIELGGKFAEQDLNAARAGAEAMYTLGLGF